MFTKKMFQLLKILDSRPITSMKSDFIADKLNISVRTCKRYIDEINHTIDEYGAHIRADKTGYYLVISNEELFESFVQAKSKVFEGFGSNNEMTFEIIKRLLVNEYISQDKLTEQLYISRSTLNKLIPSIKSVLGIHNIELKNKPYYGYYIEGNELDIRNYMVRTLFLSGEFHSLEPELYEDSNVDYREIGIQIIEIFKNYHLEYNDFIINNLMKYLIVGIHRIKHGHTIAFNNSLELLHPVIQDAAEDISKLLNYEGVSENIKEISYIAFIIGNRICGKGHIPENNTIIKFTELIEQLLDQLHKKYKVDFREDEELKNGLFQHLYASYSRYWLKATIPNPLLSSIKSQYIEAYDYSLFCCKWMEEECGLTFSDDDIGYIAMYFAVALEKSKSISKLHVLLVCGSGQGTAQLIKARLMNAIDNIEIVGVTSSIDIVEEDLTGINFIITTVSLFGFCSDLPVVRITPLLSEEDLKKIKYYRDNFEHLSYLKTLFHEELFFAHMNAKTKEDCIDYITKQLIEKGYISEQIREAIFERENMSSTEISDLVAIPHCFHSDIVHSILAIGILEQPICWDKTKVQLVIVGIINPTTTENKYIFPLLYRLIKNYKKVCRLVTLKDYPSFFNALFADIEINI